MYAVFQNGSRQYKVIEGQIIRLEKLNIKIGESIKINKVMIIANENNIQIGNPYIDNGEIIAKIILHGRENKIIVIKFNRRKHFDKHQGHRQCFTDIKITKISNILF